MGLDRDRSSGIQLSFHAWEAGRVNANAGLGERIFCLREFKLRIGHVHSGIRGAIHETAGVFNLCFKLRETIVNCLRGPAWIIV
jgi:hypothetical protein